MNSPVRDDSILPVTRVVHGALALVVAPFAWALTLHPDRTAENFSWPIGPTMSAMFFGALYAAVVFGYLRVAFSRRWHEVALVLFATLPVLALLGLVSILHWEKFAHGTVRIWVWITAYFVFPPVLLAMILLNRGRDPRTHEPLEVEVPASVRHTTLVLGILVGLVGLGLLVAPVRVAGIWPWTMKPLAAQAIGCLLLAPAVVQLVAARERRWSALRLPTQIAILWFTFVLAAVARAWPEFDRARPSTWVFLVFIALEWILAVATYFVLEARRQRAANLVTDGERAVPAEMGAARS
ncbi:MAG: hypothetical protein JNK02_02575 [Planctomycetes bacterium]|nr:hypothetical protein [Planctomycetota bacterium]